MAKDTWIPSIVVSDIVEGAKLKTENWDVWTIGKVEKNASGYLIAEYSINNAPIETDMILHIVSYLNIDNSIKI